MTLAQIKQAWPRLVALLVFAAALAVQHNAVGDLAGDDGLYLVVGRALAHGRWAYLHLPGVPPAVGVGPVYPALLAVISAVWPAFPANEALAALVDAACLGVAAFLLGRMLARSGAGFMTRYVATPAGLLAFPLLAQASARQAVPELLALAVASMALLQSGVTPRRAVLAGVLSGLAALTLNAGLGVVLGVSAALWRRERRAALVHLAAAALVVTPWIVWNLSHAQAAPWFAPVFWSVASGAHVLAAIRVVGDTLVGNPRVGMAVLVLGTAVAARGWWRNASLPEFLGAGIGGVSVVALALPAASHAVWLVILWLMIGLAAAVDRAAGAERVALAGVVTLAVVGLAVGDVLALNGRGPVREPHLAARSRDVQFTSFVVEQPDGAVVATTEAPLFYLMTSRSAVPALPPGEVAPHADSIVRRYCDAHVALVAVPDSTSSAAVAVRALRASRPTTLQPLYELSQGLALYRFQCNS